VSERATETPEVGHPGSAVATPRVRQALLGERREDLACGACGGGRSVSLLSLLHTHHRLSALAQAPCV